MTANDNYPAFASIREALAECDTWLLQLERRLTNQALSAAERAEAEAMKQRIEVHRAGLWGDHCSEETAERRRAARERQAAAVRVRLEQLRFSQTER